MGLFPQLLEEDFQQFNSFLNDLLAKTEAETALVVEKAGYLIHQCGKTSQFDTTQVATLASNAFNATQFMATLINEPNFGGMYQQGENFSTLIMNVDENALLVVVFKAQLSVGAVKYFAATAIRQLADQLVLASARAPGQGFDLCDMDVTDIGALFQRKTAEAPVAAAEPVVSQKGPIIETVYPGKYSWCACGRSKTQPYCDGSHAGTGIQPLEVDIPETRQVAWCACKHSQNKPFCDGTHSKLP